MQKIIIKKFSIKYVWFIFFYLTPFWCWQCILKLNSSIWQYSCKIIYLGLVWRCFRVSTLVNSKKNLRISKLFAISKFQVLLPNITPRLWVSWFTTLIRRAYSIYEHLNNYGFIPSLISLRPIKDRRNRSSDFCTFHLYSLCLRFVNPSILPRITYAINITSRTSLPYGIFLCAIFYSILLDFLPFVLLPPVPCKSSTRAVVFFRFLRR